MQFHGVATPTIAKFIGKMMVKILPPLALRKKEDSNKENEYKSHQTIYCLTNQPKKKLKEFRLSRSSGDFYLVPDERGTRDDKA